MDTITKEIQKQHPWTLLFAEDVMLASESRDDLQKQVQSWKDQLQQYGLRLNTSKIECMECGPRIEDGDIDQEGRARVNAAWMKWNMATGVLCDKKVPVRLKSKIYKTVVRPVALYGCECWPTTKTLERVLPRYGDADVEVDDRCNAKRESIQRHCTFHLRRRPDN
ncbi:hypothetical protein RB195_015154 [Necator americanus]|uniref:Reverse transcriptase domain-containing protein n=1 Tax=Necator americanus TaxID=51031 RepID=A0ABR1E383_NECAM